MCLLLNSVKGSVFLNFSVPFLSHIMHTGVTFSASHLKNLTKGSMVKGLSCPREVLSFTPASQTREGKGRGGKKEGRGGDNEDRKRGEGRKRRR